MIPVFEGRPIRVELRRSLGPHLAASHMNRRVILLDREVLRKPGEFERILIHEMFHFVWRRMANGARRSWEDLLRREIGKRAAGELGWSAEWRKAKLNRRDRTQRTASWRRYACESFCDTAAWRYAGLRTHEEFTIAARFRRARRAWFEEFFSRAVVAI